MSISQITFFKATTLTDLLAISGLAFVFVSAIGAKLSQYFAAWQFCLTFTHKLNYLNRNLIMPMVCGGSLAFFIEQQRYKRKS